MMMNATEYLIKWPVPTNYDSSNVLRKLPSPISKQMTEIYNYAIRKDGFYLIDRNVDSAISWKALKLFVNEALAYSHRVEIEILKK